MIPGIIPIPSDHEKHVLFLVIHERVAYVTDYGLIPDNWMTGRAKRERYFGFKEVYPSELNTQERAAVIAAVTKAKEEDLFDGHPQWFAPYRDACDVGEGRVEGIPVGMFCHGIPEGMPLKMRVELTRLTLPLLVQQQARLLAVMLTIEDQSR